MSRERAAFAVLSFVAAASFATAQSSTASEWQLPRTSWGDPDLSGIYSNDDETGTPMERPHSRGPFNSYLDMGLYDRCITRGIPNSMMPAGYGSRYEIVQAPDTVEWAVTFEDASTWERPWTFSMPLTQVDYTQRSYEYACHEGNLAMRNILSGARAAEAAAE